jgi:hypothetical protein
MGEEGMTMKFLGILAATPLLAACSMEIGAISFSGDSRGVTTQTASIRAATQEALLQPDGSCGANVNIDPSTLRPNPAAIKPGISECELVRLKGEAPTDVLIGESGKGQREVQVLYSEPGGREIYLFIDNKLNRIVKPGQT